MTAPPVTSPRKNGACSSDSFSRFCVRPFVSTKMIEKVIVVAPTTAVPIRTGLAVALNVLPAPSFSSRRSFARSKRTSKWWSRLSCSRMPGSVSITDSSKTDCALSVTGPYESTAIVTGPMPRKPNATRPNAKTAGASIRLDIEALDALTRYPIDISETMLRPSQYALKFPATKPARMLSDAPPSLDAVTTSLTWLDSTEVNTLTSSGMIAPASVPQVMMVASFHQSVPSPRSGISTYDTM